VKIVIAGLGSVGQRHLRNLRLLLGDDVELLAHRVRGLPHVITERMTLDESTSVDERYGVRSFFDLDEALAQRPRAVIVCNPTSMHLATASAAIRAGAHVLIEKPLSDSIDGVDELVACAERRHLVAAVGYQLRFHPALRVMREWLEAGRIGPVRRVRAEWGEYLPDAHPYEDYRQSYAARADLGGGVILCYIHEFDYLGWLFGKPRTVSTTGGRSPRLETGVEDWAETSIVTDRGIAIELRQSFDQQPPTRTCVAVGERGTIAVDLNAPWIELRAADGSVMSRQTFDGFTRNTMFIDEMKTFLAAIDGGAAAVSAREAAVSLRAALAAKQSLATGQAVALP
jgi:predicted dehydrogenase